MYVPYHDSMTKGRKRALPMPAKAVYIELCLHCRDRDGSCQLPDGDPVEAIVDLLGVCNRTYIEEAIPLLIAEGMLVIGEGRFSIPSWEDWQIGARTSAERAKQYRARKAIVTEPLFGTVTDRGSVPSHSVTYREEKRRVEESIVPSRDATPAKRSKARSPCPPGNAIEAQSFAGQWEIDSRDPEYVRFLDYHRSKGSLMADWASAWRLWKRNQADWGPRGGGKETPQTIGAVLVQDTFESARQVDLEAAQRAKRAEARGPRVAPGTIADLMKGMVKNVQS